MPEAYTDDGSHSVPTHHTDRLWRQQERAMQEENKHTHTHAYKKQNMQNNQGQSKNC